MPGDSSRAREEAAPTSMAERAPDVLEVLARARALSNGRELMAATSAAAQRESQVLRAHFAGLRSDKAEDRRFRLAALNLLEDVATEQERRRSAEAQVERSQERYRLLFASITEGFAVIEAQGDAATDTLDWFIVESNPAFTRHTGLNPRPGMSLRDLLPNVQKEWYSRFAKVMEIGDAFEFEDYALDAGRWLRVSAAPIPDSDPAHLAIVVTDVTSRKHAEQALRASEERLRLMIENAREYAIVTMSVERVIESFSPGAEMMLGYAAPEVVGECADLIFTPEDRACGVPGKEARTALHHGRASDERWHVRKDGTRFWGSGVMTAMRDADGKAIGLLKIFRDQTAEREATQALEQSRARTVQALKEAERARAEAESATQAKDHFLAVLSHELRTPLTPILLASEMLAKRPDLPENVREALRMIQRNVKLEAQFVDDLLDVTRIARGKMELALVPVDLHDVIRQALEITSPEFQSRKQQLLVDLKADRHEVLGDFPRLQQAVWNLLKNASKFTSAEGGIEVRTWNTPGSVQVEVKDTGVGIEPTMLNDIFDAFTQADANIARQYGGLGLGLHIVKAIMTAHGGEIRADSAGADRGSTFTMRLPVRPPDGRTPSP